MSDGYDFWRRGLAGETNMPFEEGKPEFGRYRSKRSDGGWDPVAIFPSQRDGSAVVMVGQELARDPLRTWLFCASRPISEEVYNSVMAGGNWPDMDETVAAAIEAGETRRGRNEPDDPLEMLRDQIESAAAGVGAYSSVADEEAAQRGQSLRSRLLELAGQAEKNRKDEKDPHFEAGKAVDAKWKPVIDMAVDAAKIIKDALEAFDTARAKAAAQEAARLREERRKAEEEARKAVEAGKPAPALPAAPPVPEPTLPSTIKGGYGRAASMRTVKVVRVGDQDQVYQALRTAPELVSLLAKLAQKAVDAGGTVPGVEIEERRKVA